MRTQDSSTQLPLNEVARMADAEMLPLSAGFSYLSLIPMPDEDLKPYVHEPVASIPPGICALLPPVRIVLVPYMAWNADRSDANVWFKQPPARDAVRINQTMDGKRMLLLLAMRSEPVPEFHDTFFRAVTRMAADALNSHFLESYASIVKAELQANVHGEVGEDSWNLKQDLNGAIKGKRFSRYLAASLEDTMSLYLHGICCDIDVEKGPRQLASRYLRKRLDSLHQFFPPPDGFAVFPEHLRAK